MYNTIKTFIKSKDVMRRINVAEYNNIIYNNMYNI